MRRAQIFATLILFLFITSCSSTAQFPISNVVPAAEIKAKKTTNSNNNHVLELKIRNLASADRLNPAGNNYSVWIVTKDNGVRNVGQLNVDNAEKSSFEATTPFDFDEVFITVEDQGNLPLPKGREISRTKI